MKGASDESWYTDVLPVGWYDGPTWGFAAGPSPGDAWAFDLVALDAESLEWKLYCAGPISKSTYQDAVRAGSALWPAGEQDSDQPQEGVFSRLRELWSSAGAASQVILTSRLDKAPERITTLVSPEHHEACAELLGSKSFAHRVPVGHLEPVILPRDAFLRYCTRFFGPMSLRDLDSDV